MNILIEANILYVFVKEINVLSFNVKSLNFKNPYPALNLCIENNIVVSAQIMTSLINAIFIFILMIISFILVYFDSFDFLYVHQDIFGHELLDVYMALEVLRCFVEGTSNVDS